MDKLRPRKGKGLTQGVSDSDSQVKVGRRSKALGRRVQVRGSSLGKMGGAREEMNVARVGGSIRRISQDQLRNFPGKWKYKKYEGCGLASYYQPCRARRGRGEEEKNRGGQKRRRNIRRKADLGEWRTFRVMGQYGLN